MTDDLCRYLQSRRSTPSPFLSEPGPDSDALATILRIAARTPDHGKLAPWRFIVYARSEGERALAALTEIAERSPDEKDRRNRADKARAFAASPLVIAIVSAPKFNHPKIPVWEQELSAGAVCMNVLHAAHSLGFSAQWLTGWMAYDPAAAECLGVRSGERVAGFVHIGTPTAPSGDRDRPDIAELTSFWQADPG